MRLRREASIGIASVLGLQILLSVLAISLLMRMIPAVGKILDENVASEVAVEEMLAALALSKEPTHDIPQTFEQALGRAKNNITEKGEDALLAQVDELKLAAFGGDYDAKEHLVYILQQIGDSNRQGMDVANENAKALGEAGAWAAALLGAMALGLGILTYRRLLMRIELPIDRILATFLRIRAGNHQARCNTGGAPVEIRQIGNELNWIVDQWQKALSRKNARKLNRDDRNISRRLLCAVVDQYEKPLIIRDAKGNQVAANYLAIGLDTTNWVEKPLIKTEYYFFLPPDDLPDSGEFVKGAPPIAGSQNQADLNTVFEDKASRDALQPPDELDDEPVDENNEMIQDDQEKTHDDLSHE